ncbi:MAG: hypothetical protein M3N56_11015 [Actinomycetota bacterium]|nr:hypothetical protein [Actinomycetota bacterium]
MEAEDALAARSVVACVVGDGEYDFVTKPRTCNFAHRGGDPSVSADDVLVHSMDRWRKWGKPKTRAIGTLTGNMGFSQRMRVILSKRERCGEQWRYGRVQIGKPGSKPTIDLQTFTC